MGEVRGRGHGRGHGRGPGVGELTLDGLELPHEQRAELRAQPEGGDDSVEDERLVSGVRARTATPTRAARIARREEHRRQAVA